MKVCLACSHGGHFREMKKIEKAVETFDFFYATYTITKVDKDIRNYYMEFPYSKKRYFGNFFLYFKSILFALMVILKEDPDVIMTTGGGEIAVPFCYIGKLFGKKIVFIESLARVNNLSGGGKLVYFIGDLFLVQWEILSKKYHRAKYWGNVL